VSNIVAVVVEIAALLSAGGDSLPAPAKPNLQVPPEETYELRPAKDGSGDLLCDRPGFLARVARDGTVKFTDKRVSDFKFLPLLPKAVRLNVPSLQSSFLALLQGKRPAPQQPPDDRLPPPETTALIPETSRYRPDPREGSPNLRFGVMLVDVSGRFDVSDELVRLSGKDPQRYEKARFLTATREARTGMAAKTHAENVRRASASLPALLDSIECDVRLSPHDRHAILEALREEMDRATPEGREAIARITEFLRTHADPTAPACAP